jgi:tetratricopeptide (TPR) repeat protein
MIQAEEFLAQGHADSLPFDSADSAAGATVSHFLRHYRARPDLAGAVNSTQEESFLQQIEEVRTLLAAGDLEQAETVLSSISPSSNYETAEYELEWFRLRVFQARFSDALEISKTLLRNQDLSEISRMTCLQLRGHCLIQQRQYQEAIIELQRGSALAGVYGRASSAFSIHAFLVQAYAEAGQSEEAFRVLSSLRARIGFIDQNELWLDRLLTLIRAETHYHRCLNDLPSLVAALVEAREIARWIGDTTTLRKCNRELSEVPIYSSCAVATFAEWSYLPARSLILEYFPKRVRRLKLNSQLSKALEILSSGPVPVDTFFEKMWSIPYHPERHGTHLRATLSNLRRLLPKGALLHADGKITLR